MRLTSNWLRVTGIVVGSTLGLSLGCGSNEVTKRGITGGSGASLGSGGQVGAGAGPQGSGGTAVILPGGSGSGGGGGRPPGCNDLTIEFTEVVPTVLLLVDTSSSMFEPRTSFWDPLYNALMDPTNGVVKPLEDKVRFGFTGYRSITQPIPDPECPKLTSVDFGLANYAAINTAYTALGVTPTTNFKWETPTGDSIRAVTATLKTYAPVPAGPKYILLVTDGNPDTCAHADPQCGADSTIKAVQDAFAAGIGTFVVGIGDIVTGTNAGCVGRCGKDHLQDIANAGAGLPVAANSNEYAYQVCTGSPAGLTATYANVDAGAVPGTEPYFTPSGQAELATAIADLINNVRGCTFEMNAKVTGNPALGTVLVDNQSVAFNDPNGWKLEPNTFQITLEGTACDKIKNGGKELNISFPCESIIPR